MRNILLVVGAAGLISTFAACGGGDKPNAISDDNPAKAGSRTTGGKGSGGSTNAGGADNAGAGGDNGVQASNALRRQDHPRRPNTGDAGRRRARQPAGARVVHGRAIECARCDGNRPDLGDNHGDRRHRQDERPQDRQRDEKRQRVLGRLRACDGAFGRHLVDLRCERHEQTQRERHNLHLRRSRTDDHDREPTQGLRSSLEGRTRRRVPSRADSAFAKNDPGADVDHRRLHARWQADR